MRFIAFITIIVCSVLAGCDSPVERVATVNGQPIAKEAFDAYMKHKRIAARDEQQRNSVLDKYLEREALAGVIESQGSLDKALTEAELNEFRKEMLISRYFEQYLRDNVTDDAVRNYYTSHIEQYQERKVNVAHVLVRTTRNMGDVERQAKATTAQEAYSKLSAGESFESVVEAYSEDTVSAKKGGDLGWLKEGSIHAKFSDAAFSLKAGKISEPVETPFGFHIIKLSEGPQVIKKPFESVSGNIRYQLRNEVKEAELKRLLAEVKIEKVN
ncbi:peptidylprolyl isomerase [Pseudomonadota bacterium]